MIRSSPLGSAANNEATAASMRLLRALRGEI